MSKKENKVQFNLKNVHYAVLTEEGDSPVWATPVHVPGAVTLTMDAQGEVKPFYADGIVYYRSVSNDGYAGDLEMARYPDQMLKDVWGMTINETDKVLKENANIEPKAFALLYQIDGDVDNQHYCLYNCIGTRPGIGGETKTSTKEPKTNSSSITASPLENGDVMARTTYESPDEVRNNWFKSVYQESAAVAETNVEETA